MTSPPPTGEPATPSRLRQAALVVGGLVAALWLIEIADRLLFSDALERHGIAPRRLDGLEGILLAPLLHDDFGHLLANTIPLLVLGGLVMVYGLNRFVAATAVIVLGAGTAMWLLARSGNHVGASVLVFGYLGFLLGTGYFRRSIGSIALAVVVGLTYGGLLWGVLPTTPGVSWEGHLFGFLAGVAAAALVWGRPAARTQDES